MKQFRTGDCILACDDLYGGTYRLFHDVYEDRYGVEFHFIDFTDIAAVERALAEHPNTKALFIETPTNPMMYVFDIKALADLPIETMLSWLWTTPSLPAIFSVLLSWAPMWWCTAAPSTFAATTT